MAKKFGLKGISMGIKNNVNEWLFCKILYWKDSFQEIDNLSLVKDEYRNFVKSNSTQVLYRCIEESDDYLTLQSKNFRLEVKREAVSKILPNSIFSWNEEVYDRSNRTVVKVDDIIWHDKEQKYFYLISLNGKKKSRRYTDAELEKY
jgi:hypothetical protein